MFSGSFLHNSEQHYKIYELQQAIEKYLLHEQDKLTESEKKLSEEHNLEEFLQCLHEPIYSDKNKFQIQINSMLQAATNVTNMVCSHNIDSMVKTLNIYEYILSNIIKDLLLYCNYDKSVPDLDWYIIELLKRSKVRKIDLNKLVLFIKKEWNQDVNKKEIEKVTVEILKDNTLKHLHAKLAQQTIEMTDELSDELIDGIIDKDICVNWHYLVNYDPNKTKFTKYWENKFEDSATITKFIRYFSKLEKQDLESDEYLLQMLGDKLSKIDSNDILIEIMKYHYQMLQYKQNGFFNRNYPGCPSCDGFEEKIYYDEAFEPYNVLHKKIEMYNIDAKHLLEKANYPRFLSEHLDESNKESKTQMMNYYDHYISKHVKIETIKQFTDIEKLLDGCNTLIDAMCLAVHHVDLLQQYTWYKSLLKINDGNDLTLKDVQKTFTKARNKEKPGDAFPLDEDSYGFFYDSKDRNDKASDDFTVSVIEENVEEETAKEETAKKDQHMIDFNKGLGMTFVHYGTLIEEEDFILKNFNEKWAVKVQGSNTSFRKPTLSDASLECAKSMLQYFHKMIVYVQQAHKTHDEDHERSAMDTQINGFCHEIIEFLFEVDKVSGRPRIMKQFVHEQTYRLACLSLAEIVIMETRKDQLKVDDITFYLSRIIDTFITANYSFTGLTEQEVRKRVTEEFNNALIQVFSYNIYSALDEQGNVIEDKTNLLLVLGDEALVVNTQGEKVTPEQYLQNLATHVCKLIKRNTAKLSKPDKVQDQEQDQQDQEQDQDQQDQEPQQQVQIDMSNQAMPAAPEEEVATKKIEHSAFVNLYKVFCENLANNSVTHSIEHFDNSITEALQNLITISQSIFKESYETEIYEEFHDCVEKQLRARLNEDPDSIKILEEKTEDGIRIFIQAQKFATNKSILESKLKLRISNNGQKTVDESVVEVVDDEADSLSSSSTLTRQCNKAHDDTASIISSSSDGTLTPNNNPTSVAPDDLDGLAAFNEEQDDTAAEVALLHVGPYSDSLKALETARFPLNESIQSWLNSQTAEETVYDNRNASSSELDYLDGLAALFEEEQDDPSRKSPSSDGASEPTITPQDVDVVKEPVQLDSNSSSSRRTSKQERRQSETFSTSTHIEIAKNNPPQTRKHSSYMYEGLFVGVIIDAIIILSVLLTHFDWAKTELGIICLVVLCVAISLIGMTIGACIVDKPDTVSSDASIKHHQQSNDRYLMI